jgi:hypothetical protein
MSAVAAPAADPQHTETLLMRCTRSDLEQMLKEHIMKHEPITLSIVESYLSEAQQQRRGAPSSRKKGSAATVSGGELRTGTGPFDALTQEIHTQIFTRLSLQDKLTVAIAVCKSWRVLRTWAPLWDKLPGHMFGRWINKAGYVRLMRWLPANCATTFQMPTRDFDSPSLCTAFKAHRRWQGGLGAKQTGPAQQIPAIQNLRLHGKRLGATAFKTAILLVGPNLKNL